MKRNWKRIISFLMIAGLCAGIFYPAAGQVSQAAAKKTITKALTKKTYKPELKYTDKSLYLPDFGLFTNLECSPKKTSGGEDGKEFRVTYYLSGEKRDTWLAEYIKLLQEDRFHLTLIESYDKSYNGYEHFVNFDFKYTGSGKVTEQTASVFAENPYHVSIYYINKGSKGCDVHILYAPEFKLVDTLDRVGGKKIKNPAIKGTSARKGLYRDTKGVFKTTDGRLSVKPGYADIIVNGKHYKKKVMFTSDGVPGDGFVNTSPTIDYFKIDNYRNSEDLFISFPYNSSKKGNLYGMADLMYREPVLWETYMFHNKTHGTRLGIRFDDKDYLTAWGNKDNIYDYMTIRVLNWNKKGTTLVYFAAKLQEPGKKAYTMEGLIAGKYKKGAAANTSGSGSSGSSSSSSGSSGTTFKKDCTFCHGKKDCPTCNGYGKVYSYVSGKRDKNCTDCSGTGKCWYCHGTGKQQ